MEAGNMHTIQNSKYRTISHNIYLDHLLYFPTTPYIYMYSYPYSLILVSVAKLHLIPLIFNLI